MSKCSSITIKEAMSNVVSNKYLLPAIQRKFEWGMDQIEMLFDSIMRNYPINSFMFWKVTDPEIKHDYKFYTFIKDYAQRYKEDNLDASPNLLGNDFFAIIDGQQRLTSLYIGLDGSYRAKRANKWWKNNEDALPTRRLYIELSEPSVTLIDNQKLYNFRFLTQGELNEDVNKHPKHRWFKVGDVLRFRDRPDVERYLAREGLATNEFSKSTLEILFSKINEEALINYYIVEEQDQDKVLEVFLRTNSGGTPLSFSDLLMSIASANWDQYDAREEMRKVREEIRTFGSPSFDVSQDFVLKSILVLSGGDVKFKINNFNKTNVEGFELNWGKIRKSLVAAFELLEQLGFNDTVLRAKNAAIPIAYYIYKNELADRIVKSTYDKQDKKNISKWLSMSLLKGIFGGQSDRVLTSLREIISNSTAGKFPINEIFDKFKSNPDKNYVFDDAVIESFLEEEYGSPAAGLVLGLIYSDALNKYGKAVAQDHMHPKNQFDNRRSLSSLGLTDDQMKFYKDKGNYNSVLNLQLLEKSLNESKGSTSLKDWAMANNKTSDDLCIKPTTSLDIKDFEEFIKDRKETLVDKLKTILSV